MVHAGVCRTQVRVMSVNVTTQRSVFPGPPIFIESFFTARSEAQSGERSARARRTGIGECEAG